MKFELGESVVRKTLADTTRWPRGAAGNAILKALKTQLPTREGRAVALLQRVAATYPKQLGAGIAAEIEAFLAEEV